MQTSSAHNVAPACQRRVCSHAIAHPGTGGQSWPGHDGVPSGRHSTLYTPGQKLKLLEDGRTACQTGLQSLTVGVWLHTMLQKVGTPQLHFISHRAAGPLGHHPPGMHHIYLESTCCKGHDACAFLSCYMKWFVSKVESPAAAPTASWRPPGQWQPWPQAALPRDQPGMDVQPGHLPTWIWGWWCSGLPAVLQPWPDVACMNGATRGARRHGPQWWLPEGCSLWEK